jgi:hypothetical protein
MAIYALDLLFAVARPERPEGEIRPVGCGKPSEPIDSAVFTNPVPSLHMVRMGILGKPGSLSLLRGEVALLLLGELEKPC